TRAEVARLLEPAALRTALHEAFIAYSLRRSVAAQRFVVPLPAAAPAGSNGMLLAPGLIDGIPAYSVKVHAKFPAQKPAITGVLALHDLQTGHLLALMESSHLTAMRTGVAGALGTDALARPDAGIVAIVGAGAQGELQLRALAAIRRLERAVVHDTYHAAAVAFCAKLGPELGLPMRAEPELRRAVQAADIVIAATWSTTAFIDAAMLRPGTHVTTLGPDQPGKAELAADAIQAGLFVCDDPALALSMGALGGVGLGPEAIHAELGEVLAGTRPGRTEASQITVFGSVGLAFQDLAAGWLVYQRAGAEGLGRTINFLI
ncbi:ornithine cyclodeaminase family protein, partial [Vineibacter terrae]|uniref:ornithine cyclodeaminase family protein n=1 Tax=Vineibacter terrae TaxID=2586908 RepID=UPI002E35DD4F